MGNADRQREWRKNHPATVADHNRIRSEVSTARRRRVGTQAEQSKPFAGIDGEGGDIDGRHEYLLLRAGEYTLETGRPLRSVECLEFLAGLPKDVIYVGYYFTYDTTMILRDLSEYKIRRLLDRNARMVKRRDGKRTTQTLPVDWEGFEIDCILGKELMVRKVGDDEWTVIHDCADFFQGSFVSALKKWDVGSEGERGSIEANKLLRSTFTEITDETRDYNTLECQLLEKLMNKFRAVCIGAGYVPRKWQGPGFLAEKMLQVNKIPRKAEIVSRYPRELLELANAAYVGGRSETAFAGQVIGPVKQKDINSAYPWAISHLPCLKHGWFEKHYGLPDDGSLYLAKGKFYETKKSSFYGLPVRSKVGTISFPASGQGIYWSCEIEAAVHQRFAPEVVWIYRTTCDCHLFNWVNKSYEYRLRIGKSDKGVVIKLGLNAVYGKMCQSIGGAPYANPLWGSLITAMVRARISEKLCNGKCRQGKWCGTDVVMIATDAIYIRDEIEEDSKNPREFSVSENLGHWSDSLHPDGIFVIQPGMYFGSDSPRPKTRGVPMHRVQAREDEFRKLWEDILQSGNLGATVSIPVPQFMGLRLGAHRRRFSEIGQWTHDCPHPDTCTETGNHVHKEISFDWTTKRKLNPVSSYGSVMTLPLEGSPDEINYPYTKELGQWRDELRIDEIDTVEPELYMQPSLF